MQTYMCVSWVFSSCGASVGFLTRYDGEFREPLVQRQRSLTPCDPRDGSPPGSPIPGILQARTLEWVAISFSNA